MKKSQNIYIASETFAHLITNEDFDEDKSTDGSLNSCGSVGGINQLRNLCLDSDEDSMRDDDDAPAFMMKKSNSFK